jgi:hypothetical protein
MKRKGPERDSERERFWRSAVGQQERSGRSIREYCRVHGLSEASFYAWRREIRRRGRQRGGKVAGQGRKPGFVPVRIAEAVVPIGGAMIECLLPSGALLRLPAGMEPAAVAAVLCAWERSRC